MSTFRETFERVEHDIRPLLEKYGFTLKEISITDENGNQWVGGSAHYVESGNWYSLSRKKRFIRLSTAPLRLELDLDVGIGDSFYTIYELHELAGGGVFPERTHDLYKAMHDEGQLRAEFQRLVQVLKDCGERFFSNDPSLWTDLSNQRTRRTQERENKQISKDAEVAFKKQDWKTVVTLLGKKNHSLNKLDVGRLSYARKKLKST